MSVAQDIRGLKRICMSCGTRFYDMNKRPIACPSCDTEFTGEIKVKTRRSRIVANDPIVEELDVKKGKLASTEDEEFLEAEEGDLVSLEDVAAGDDGDDVEEEATDPDLDIDPDLEDIDAIEADIDDGLGDEDEDLEIEADLEDEN